MATFKPFNAGNDSKFKTYNSRKLFSFRMNQSWCEMHLTTCGKYFIFSFGLFIECTESEAKNHAWFALNSLGQFKVDNVEISKKAQESKVNMMMC
jgi:hypothetical protein